ncbi:MAG: VOC family protein [Saprospiraceae bacterium]|nr:VOC family protein [Saprospiraceae bacterium]
MNKAVSILSLLMGACLAWSGLSSNGDHDQRMDLEALQIELHELREGQAAKGQITTFLTFQENNAEEAMLYYVDLFENSRVTNVRRYGNDGPAPEGSILMATFELNGSPFACSDSYIKHAWTFTPGVSNWVTCETDEEIERIYEGLSRDGNVLMPLDQYSWSKRFAFVEDQFGVSWQLNID